MTFGYRFMLGLSLYYKILVPGINCMQTDVAMKGCDWMDLEYKGDGFEFEYDPDKLATIRFDDRNFKPAALLFAHLD